MTVSKLFATVAAAAMVSASAALAQDAQQDTQQQDTQELDVQLQDEQQQDSQQQAQGQQQDQQVANQCLEDLQEFRARMDEEGYWLTGAGGRWGWGVGPRAGTQPMTAPEDTEDTEGAVTPPPGQPIPDATTPGAAGVAPWGRSLTGIHAPSYQIRGLLTGARILALRGEQQACDATLAELNEVYDDFVQQAETAGIDPEAVVNWRQESLLAAQPVDQFELAGINVDDITGTEIRNLQDEQLGTVDDVLVAPDGTILYLIVSRGGFLGLGEEHVAVPWQGLQATPGLNTFVLDVDEGVVEQAPTVDADQFALPEVYENRHQEIDDYWQQHMAS